MQGSCDKRISAGQQSNLCLWRGAFQPVSFDPEVRQYWPDFEFWQCLIKERQETFIHVNLSGVSRQQIGCKWVCSGGTSGDLTATKETVFCNFNQAYLPCCLYPSSPNVPFDRGGSLEGQVQNPY